MVETKGERASFLSKEVRRIAFSEITKNDLPELYNALNKLFWGRRNCKLWVHVGRFNGWFNNEKELAKFLDGFAVAMLFLDDDFLNACGDARAGHPQL
ncbi:MAG: hypothetical protein ABSG87_02885 [Verrucomicrobiota bacterium]|jgi:hypothetical protein